MVNSVHKQEGRTLGHIFEIDADFIYCETGSRVCM